MAFKCNSCEKKAGNFEMAGMVIGQIGKGLLVAWGVAPNKRSITVNSIAGKLTTGIVNGFGITCPKCRSVDWDHTE
ncbi:MAG TPA: hypothetical protein VFD33_06790 [Bacillota bacterium]|nr:hypothetical protein [Bacillota bacterium]